MQILKIVRCEIAAVEILVIILLLVLLLLRIGVQEFHWQQCIDDKANVYEFSA